MHEKKIDKINIAIIFGILLKIVLMGLFSSDYQNKMFEPFIADWFEGIYEGNFNPYQNYYDNGMHIDFPYPAVMLFIMSSGKLLCNFFSEAPLFIHNILFKLPLLVFDIVCFMCLNKLFPGKKVMCIWVYFFSPIILYSTYMHGQLDIIPMAFVLISLCLISGKKSKKGFIFSSVFAALAFLSKFHVAAIIPLIVIYVAKRYGRLSSLLYSLSVCAFSAVGIALFMGDGFVNGVIFNNELSTLFVLYFPYKDLSLYLCFFVLIFIYFYIFNFNIINRDLLFGFSGAIFAVFLALCVPMPGWFVWIVPFVAFFMLSVNCKLNSIIAYVALQGCYIFYFVFFHIKQNVCDLYFLDNECSMLKCSNGLLRNIFFSLLICALVYMIYQIYRFGIASNGTFNFHHKSFVIGICGDSSTGKSTLQDNLLRFFRKDHILLIEGDGDHRWERDSSNWNEYTHLDPKANYLYRQAMDILKLKNGQTVQRVNYDHSTGKFTRSKMLFPKRFISISGLHTFYLPQLRDILDLKIFMEADEELRCLWKINRDSNDRSRTKDSVLEQIESRRDDTIKYIVPQRMYADIIIQYLIDEKAPLRVGMRLFVSTTIDIEPIVEVLKAMGVSITYDFTEDLKYQVAEYHDHPCEERLDIDFDVIANEVLEHGYELIDSAFDAVDIMDAVRNLIILKAISVKMKELKE